MLPCLTIGIILLFLPSNGQLSKTSQRSWWSSRCFLSNVWNACVFFLISIFLSSLQLIFFISFFTSLFLICNLWAMTLIKASEVWSFYDLLEKLWMCPYHNFGTPGTLGKICCLFFNICKMALTVVHQSAKVLKNTF